MRTLLARLRVSLVLVGFTTLLLVPAVSADSDHGPNGVSGRLASGFTRVTVSGSGISGSPDAATCASTPTGWAAPIAGSEWISSHSDCTVSVDTANFTYTTTFTLPGDLSGLQNLALNGSFMADDSATVQLNGHQIFNSGNFGGNLSSPSSFSTTDSSFFQPGTNTLVFTVSNSGGGASGVDFIANVTANGQTLVGVGTVGAPHENGEGDEGEGGAHGDCVSAAAHNHTLIGRNHGADVSAAAHDCGH